MLRLTSYPASCHHSRHDAAPARSALLPTIWSAFVEALAGSRQYRNLRSRGVSHDAAIRQALGIDAHQTHPSKPLYFAGRA